MSSNYSYKGISVSQICSNNGNAIVSGFSGMPGPITTTYSGLRPLKFGYFSGNPPIDLCNQYTAPSITISTDQTIAIRSGAKSCRIISVGGAGGGGGHGGKATAYTYNGNDEKDFGGDGGMGGYGKYNYSETSLVNYNNISITVGDGGTGGSSGSDPDSEKSEYNAGKASYTKVNVYGGDGHAGNAGKSSYIILNGTSTQLAIADGGNGGAGGIGGYAWAGQSSHDGNKGAPGTSGNTSTSEDNNYPTFNYGKPSTTISVDGGETGGGYPGNGGVVQIIWLYD
jgi:hypothetical protein